mgnify:CR=1 FL=1
MNSLVLLAGLAGLQNTLVQNWIGPAFLIVIAALAIKFMIQRQFRELAGFLAIGAVVALLIYGTDSLFGENGIFKGIADAFANALNSDVNSSGGGSLNFIDTLKFLKMLWF